MEPPRLRFITAAGFYLIAQVNKTEGRKSGHWGARVLASLGWILKRLSIMVGLAGRDGKIEQASTSSQQEVFKEREGVTQTAADTDSAMQAGGRDSRKLPVPHIAGNFRTLFCGLSFTRPILRKFCFPIRSFFSRVTAFFCFFRKYFIFQFVGFLRKGK